MEELNMKYVTRMIVEILEPAGPAFLYMVRIGYAPSSPRHGDYGEWVGLPMQEFQPLLDVLKLDRFNDLIEFKFGLPENCDVTLEFKAFLDGIRTGETVKKPVRTRLIQRAAQSLAEGGTPDFAMESPDIVREIFTGLYNNESEWEEFCALVTTLSSGDARIHVRHPRQFQRRREGVRYYELVASSGNFLFVFGPYHPQPFQYSVRLSEAPRRSR
ncbi:hypothetical protein KBC70_04195 [Candidatus Woesebacteria bacterium]|nr:hypothetical protein [Candidatus Woesebacteria bacterium]